MRVRVGEKLAEAELPPTTPEVSSRRFFDGKIAEGRVVSAVVSIIGYSSNAVACYYCCRTTDWMPVAAISLRIHGTRIV